MEDLLLVFNKGEKMESVLYCMLIAACAVFIVKSVVFFIDRSEAKVFRAVREAEQRAKKEAWKDARIGHLEDYKNDCTRNSEKIAEKIFDKMIED